MQSPDLVRETIIQPDKVHCFKYKKRDMCNWLWDENTKCFQGGSGKVLLGLLFYFIFFILFYFLIEGKLFFFFLIYLWLCWVLVSVQGLSLVVASGGHSSSQCAGLSPPRPHFVADHRLQTRRLSSCGSRAQLLCGMWDLPRPGLEPVSPALAGRLLTTAPLGKPRGCYFIFEEIREVDF